MEAELMCDAIDDLEPFTLDQDIAAMADASAAFPAAIADEYSLRVLARTGLTFEVWMAAATVELAWESQVIADRYRRAHRLAQPTSASRRGCRHLGILEGVARPPSRKSAEQVHLGEVKAWHGPRQMLRGEVA